MPAHKKRLLIVASTFPKSRSDAVSARFVFDLAKALTVYYDVYLLAPHAPGLARHEEWDSVKIFRFRYFFPEGWQALSSGEGALSDIRKNVFALIQAPFFLISQYLAARSVVKRCGIEIVNSHWLVPQGLVCALLRHKFGFIHAATAHAAEIFMLIRYKALGKFLARFVLDRTDILLPVSTYIKERTEELASRPILAPVIPMGVYIDKFKPSHEKAALRRDLKIPDRFTFLFVGKFSEKKGISFLIEAAARLKKGGRAFNLVLAGGGELLDNIKEQARLSGIGDNTYFLEWVRNDALPMIYCSADVLVVPSILDKKGETEGMPVVIQEAMACATPVIASRISGIPDIVKDGHNGWLVKPADASDLARKMEEVMSAADLASFKDCALSTARQNSYERIAARYNDAIKNISAIDNPHVIRISIHDKVNIEVRSKYCFLIDYLKKEYPRFFYNNNIIRVADIIINFDAEIPEVGKSDIYIKEKFKKIYPYTCLIKDLDGAVTSVYFRTSVVARTVYPHMVAAFLQAEIIEPLVYLKALGKGMLMMHASGVSDSSGAYLFGAQKSTGKTTTAFHMVARGYSFLGDDLVFLSKEGSMYSYPKRVHFFSYLKKKNPFLKVPACAMAVSRVNHVIRSVLGLITGKEFYLSTRLDIRDIIPGANVVEKGIKARKLFLLVSNDNAGRIGASEADRYEYMISTCDTRASLLGILSRRPRGLERYISDKEKEIIMQISSSYRLDNILVADVVRDIDKIIGTIKE